jgi:hypothetical protein
MYMLTTNMPMPNQTLTRHTMSNWNPKSHTYPNNAFLYYHNPIHQIHILPWHISRTSPCTLKSQNKPSKPRANYPPKCNQIPHIPYSKQKETWKQTNTRPPSLRKWNYLWYNRRALLTRGITPIVASRKPVINNRRTGSQSRRYMTTESYFYLFYDSLE